MKSEIVSTPRAAAQLGIRSYELRRLVSEAVVARPALRLGNALGWTVAEIAQARVLIEKRRRR